MRRSPLFHIVAGLMVVMVAFWSGMIRRWEIQRRAIQKTVCHRSTDDQLQSETTPKVAYNRPDSELGFIVKFKSGASKSAISLLLERLGAHEITTYKHLPGFSFESVSSSESVNDILAKYKADPNVEFVEPNFVYHTDDSGRTTPVLTNNGAITTRASRLTAERVASQALTLGQWLPGTSPRAAKMSWWA